MTTAIKYYSPLNHYYDLVRTGTLLPLKRYDKILVSYSGGKDSNACVLHLREMGVDTSQMELWHQLVDGRDEGQFMDWPCTESYVSAAGLNLGIPVRFQWRDKGFLGEMLRDESPTHGVYYEDGDGKVVYVPPGRLTKGTRKKFPQKSSDLNVRYCSPYVKIDVAKRAINNDS